MKTTHYFEEQVVRKRPEIRREWVERVLLSFTKRTAQENGRVSFWKDIPEFGGRVLRVVTLEDEETVHNAYFDRSFMD